MRKLGLLVAVLAMVGAVSADAANVAFGIRQAGTGSTTVTLTAVGSVSFEITATIDSAANLSDGLALWGTDIAFSGLGDRTNLAGGLLADPANVDPIQQFDYPNGVTNPPHVADASGYRGTASGTLSLLQAGGGANTIGNPVSGGAPFPIGSVITNVAQNATVVVATGTYNVPAGDGTHTLTLANCFGNTIDEGEAGPTVYNVSAATTTCGAALNIILAPIGIEFQVLSAVSKKAAAPACDLPLNLAGRTSEARATRVTQIVATYDAAPSGASTLQWNTALTPCPGAPAYVAYSGASVMSCTPSGLTMVCNFTPALENVHAYRLTLPESPGTQVIDFRVLTGDATGNGVVDAGDRSAVVGQWTSPGYSCATDVGTDITENASTDAGDRSAVVGAWTNPATRCVP